MLLMITHSTNWTDQSSFGARGVHTDQVQYLAGMQIP